MAYELLDAAPSGRYEMLDPAVSIGKSINKATNSIPRQLGLTARYALEGAADTAQIVTEPVRNLMNMFGGNIQPLGKGVSALADMVGLPSPETPTERTVGVATKLGFGAGASMGAGQLARGGGALAQEVGKFLTQQPVTQLASAAGAGLAGGASKEAGGSELSQVAASVAGGLAGAGVVGAGNAAAKAVGNMKNRMLSNQQIDVRLANVMQRAGVDYSQVPERVRQSLRADLAGALRADQEIDPAAVARLADFRANNLTPTRGMVSLDPVQITREQNLAKIGANSADGSLQGLAQIQNQNNERLIQNINGIGGGVSPQQAGQTVNSSILGTQSTLRGAEQQAWEAARASPGYRQPISPEPLNEINRALGDEGMMGYMAKPISEYMAAFQTGEQPFTPQAYRNLQSMLSKEMAKGGNEAAAAGIARDAMNRSQIRPITNPGGIDFGQAPVTAELASRLRNFDAQPSDAMGLIDSARGATRAAYQYESSNPIVRAALSESAQADPMRIAQRFVIGGTPDEAAMLAREVGTQGRETIKNALVEHLKSKALNGAADEVGKVSQSAFNKELRTLEPKLRLFFSAEERQQLESMGRAASYMQAQPVGSAVNNSNSGALLLGKGIDLLRQLPIAGPLAAPALDNISINFRQRQAQNILPGLLARQPVAPWYGGAVGPGVAVGGLLAAPPITN